MSAVEKIQAAIEKLEGFNAARPVVATFKNVDQDAAEWFARAEVKLAMFHRTIDAQLAILRDAREVSISLAQIGFRGGTGRDQLGLALAEAILA